MSTHWGEIPTLVDTDSGIAALEREQMTKLRPMEVEGPELHQPSTQDPSQSTQPHPAEAFALDSLTLHTIKLVQYARKVRQLIQSVQQQLEAVRTGEGDKDIPTFSEAPPIPEYLGRERKLQHLKPLQYTPKDLDSPFVSGVGTPPPQVDSRNCRKLLKRSVAAICSHTGYDNCGEGILESLTDITHEYFLQMTQLLRRAVDDEAMIGGTGFPDPLEQVFHEMGIGSPRGLHDFYQTRVIGYHRNMMRTCQHLVDEYEKVRNPEIKVLEDITPIIKGNVKDSSVSDIQFPTLDDEDGADTEQVIHLEGLGLDINIVNEPSSSLNTDDDGSKWSQGGGRGDLDKPSLDSYDQADTPAPGDVPSTPGVGSEAGDSLQDPASVSVSDIMSPPSIGVRTTKPPKKKMKK